LAQAVSDENGHTLSAVLIAFENGGLLKQQKINMVD
jgi:hypothetical protein